jgi:hypothetical protein
MSGEIFYTDEFGEWFADLSADDQDAVAHLVELLGQKWLALGHPYSSEIKGSRYALRELRSQKRKPIRVVYAFSPERNAVLLIGGDKTGNPRFYDEITPRAETIWERYLRERRFFGGRWVGRGDADTALLLPRRPALPRRYPARARPPGKRASPSTRSSPLLGSSRSHDDGYRGDIHARPCGLAGRDSYAFPQLNRLSSAQISVFTLSGSDLHRLVQTYIEKEH